MRALTPLNQGNPSLDILAQPGTVAIVTGQQVGLFSGPAYTVYKALTAIKAARELTERGVSAVPVFWLATEDHDFAEVDHAWVFGADHQPVKIRMEGSGRERIASGRRNCACGIFRSRELRAALAGLPFADDAVAMVERAYAPGETMGSAFASMIKELFGAYGLLLIDPMERVSARDRRAADETKPWSGCRNWSTRSWLAPTNWSNAAIMRRCWSIRARRSRSCCRTDSASRCGSRMASSPRQHQKFSAQELAARAADLSPNALLRPVVQDYLLPTAAYIGGPAELAYLAQSQVLYSALLGRQPAAFPRACFTLLDERSHKRMTRYRLSPTDLFAGEQALHDAIAARLVPEQLRRRLDETKAAFSTALDALQRRSATSFDITLAGALGTSRRKIEYQVGKIARKTATQIMARDEQAVRDARSLNGLVFPEKHLQERLYSIVPFIAKFGPGLVDELYSAVRIECPDHQFLVV